MLNAANLLLSDILRADKDLHQSASNRQVCEQFIKWDKNLIARLSSIAFVCFFPNKPSGVATGCRLNQHYGNILSPWNDERVVLNLH